MLKTRTLLRLRFNHVKKRIREGKDRGLYEVAGLVRTTAKRSMRTRPGPSRAGFPPHAHTRAGLRVIAFTVDRAASAALVGPLKFSGSRFFDQPVPFIHEFGGIFSHGRRYYSYPERSYMGWTLKKLHREGKIPRRFSVSMGISLR